jgi:CRP/FNR family cyclic AMP-dependent transcriptional regulator
VVATEVPSAGRRERVETLDAELAALLEGADRQLVLEVLDLQPGPLPVDAIRDGGLGLVVVEGMLAQETRLGEHRALLLVWDGDLIRPAPEGPAWIGGTASWSMSWEVLTPAVVAVLGAEITRAVEHSPGLLALLSHRAAAMQARAALQQAISQLPRVCDRLLAALLLVAEDRGQATVDGLVLRLPLTHERLGQLIGARRPTVSLAVAQLRRLGLLSRRDDGAWVISHDAASSLELALRTPAETVPAEPRAPRAEARHRP